MGKHSEVFVGFDTAKKRHALAVADAGRDGEIRYLGEIDSAVVAQNSELLRKSRDFGDTAVPSQA